MAEERPLRLVKGANIGLRDLDAELGSITVMLETAGVNGYAIDADVSVLLLGADGKVRTNEDFVFYNQPTSLAGAVHLRDKIRGELDDEAVSTDVVTLELDDVPEDVERIVLAASLDLEQGQSFGAARFVRMALRRSADAQELLVFAIDDATSEMALLFGEFYRRNGEWRVRAIGQGYDGGLAALVTDFGVDVSTNEPADIEVERVGAAEQAVASIAGAAEVGLSAEPSSAAPAADAEAPASERVRRVSVRRPARAPRMPADWDKTLPASDETDWQPARLFPVAGIGAGEEQERRATSALLAVMPTVKDFGRALTTRYGAPAGAMETFVEVPFGYDDQAYRPDGVIKVTRGQTTWTALVEVKTSDAKLATAQVDTYVEIARAKGYDAVITISNQLSGAADDHPVSIDRRKLKKVALHHLSWDQVRAEATILAKHRGISDATQRFMLEEFLRYMHHARSGMQGFTDMGPQWVTVRDAVKAKTLRSGDRGTVEVSSQFDQLVRHLSLHLSSLLGVDVQAIVPRNSVDAATRCQQLADSGLLFGSLRVPGAVDAMVLQSDLRAERVGCSITIDAPRDGRTLTKINWLLRQLPEARDGIRVEAMLAGGRGQSTVQLLGPLRKAPTGLVPKDGRDIRAFRLSLDMPMGAKRGTGKGSLIGSVATATNSFYAEVVQNLRAWSARPPQMPSDQDVLD